MPARKPFLAILAVLAFSGPVAQALTTVELKALQDSVKEMCLLPDRQGDYLRVEGEAKAGLPVAVKVIKGDLSGKIAYDTWKGIPITLDKYKTDPRQCALEMMKLLLPSFKTEGATKPVSQTKTHSVDSAVISVRYNRRYGGNPEFWVAQTDGGGVIVVESVSNKILRQARCQDTMGQGVSIASYDQKYFIGVWCSFKINMYSIDREADDFVLDPYPMSSPGSGYSGEYSVASALNNFASAGIGKCAYLWNVRTKALADKVGCDSWIKTIALNEFGGQLLTASDEVVSLWSVGIAGTANSELRWQTKLKSDTNPTGSVSGVAHSITKVALSTDGKHALATTVGPNAFLIDVRNGSTRFLAHHPTAKVTEAAFDPNSTMLATGATDGRIIVWLTKDASKVWTFEHDEMVSRMAFSTDGRFLISNGDDKTTRVWSLETGKETSRIEHEKSCNALDVQFKGSGDFVLIGTGRKFRSQNEKVGRFLVQEWKLTQSGKLVPNSGT